MDLSMSRRVGIRAVVFYLATTVLAVSLGIGLVLNIRPGVGGMLEADMQNITKVNMTRKNLPTTDTMMDVIRLVVFMLIIIILHAKGTHSPQILSKQLCISTALLS